MDRDLIAHEIKELSRMVSDTAAIANYINRVHGENFAARDIENIQRGAFPEARVSIPVQIRVSGLMDGALPLSRPLTTTNDNGVDPLAIACLEYGIRYGGVMGASANDCKAMLRALAA